MKFREENRKLLQDNAKDILATLPEIEKQKNSLELRFNDIKNKNAEISKQFLELSKQFTPEEKNLWDGYEFKSKYKRELNTLFCKEPPYTDSDLDNVLKSKVDEFKTFQTLQLYETYTKSVETEFDEINQQIGNIVKRCEVLKVDAENAVENFEIERFQKRKTNMLAIDFFKTSPIKKLKTLSTEEKKNDIPPKNSISLSKA